MTPRERFQAVMAFEPFDRLPVYEWAPWWNLTIDRWHEEGLPTSLTNRYDISDYFGLDQLYQEWFHPFTPDAPKPAYEGAPMIESIEDYEKIKPLLFPWPAFDEKQWAGWIEKQQRSECTLWMTMEGFFWYPRTLMGVEGHMFGMYDQPDLVHQINQDLIEYYFRVLDVMEPIGMPDFMTLAEDMSYNNGPMLSEDQFNEFLVPYYDRLVPRLQEGGTRVFADSDGDVHMAWNWYANANFDGILPLERQAGVDLAKLRKAHPESRFLGHFDKMVMHVSPDAIAQEFDRLFPVAAQGGFIVGVDHQTPPAVSLEQYRGFLDQFWDFAKRVGEASQTQALKVSS